MSDQSIRIYRETSPGGAEAQPWGLLWHVSLGSAAPLGDLRAAVGYEGDDSRGMTWDEALGTVAQAIYCPATLGPLAVHLEPPRGLGWDLVAEIIPLSFTEFEFRTTARRTDRLTAGEALAQFVAFAAPQIAFTGFRSEPVNNFALALREAVCHA